MNRNDAEELRKLADRIDPNQLWDLHWETAAALPQEQRNQLDAGVALRRYAAGRDALKERQKVGATYMRGYKLTRVDHSTDHFGCGDNAWHGAINAYSEKMRTDWKAGTPTPNTSAPWPRMMYEAKRLSDELPRMILLFEREREGLATHFKMCAHDPAPAQAMPDNHLRCALDVECRKCPFLTAIEASAAMTDDAKNEAKAWTCATHILQDFPKDGYLEEYLFDKSTALMNERMARSFSDLQED